MDEDDVADGFTVADVTVVKAGRDMYQLYNDRNGDSATVREWELAIALEILIETH